ncbi:MAG: hypothetical protein KGI54_14325 [Pseudomonadota bacterium]|nr:hypothetical protein [Pseudomonadota bacterium]
MNSVIKTAISLTCLVFILTGCATVPSTKMVYVPWVWPVYLQTCAPDPAPLPVPHIVATSPHASSEVARNIVELRAQVRAVQAAADDCRNTLAAAVAANKESK